ncbi:DUF5777 family beta-barrel protein [Jiulongibacter sediminis]|uniref:DUF5777 domain-containing protein n=1 Tax=Jiulongibacter sediminis TaxID=1605367 RepID=A0A0P7BF32_9BACT|nr:DUF5777 family beta-barrel protein [Jiulongibacter sediminis]KPM49435.1 hypothetical protein AFM12_02130 [Jiulongibacter sediminis]TBX26483.1 hypothetical protein TK44_02135 [Jiulongibacter sediminis]
MKSVLKNTGKLTLFILLFGFRHLHAQDVDDLLGELDEISPDQAQNITATFKSTRIINGHSIETVAKNHLDFRISHRFGTLNSGYNNLFGLDESRIRIGLEYGITDDLMIGAGRSSYLKEYDYFLKYRFLHQKTKGLLNPVTVTLLVSVSTNTMDTSPTMQFFNNLERQSYVGQLMIARKFGERLSLEVNPTVVHRNKTETPIDANTLYAMGVGGRLKLSKRTTFNAEYFYVANNLIGNGFERDPAFRNNLSLGFDIETGGHVFQLHISNSRGMIEKQFIGDTQDEWLKGGLYYGFNISRIFSFDKKEKH